MKTCLLCSASNNDEAVTCSECGEGSFDVSAPAAEPVEGEQATERQRGARRSRQ